MHSQNISSKMSFGSAKASEYFDKPVPPLVVQLIGL